MIGLALLQKFLHPHIIRLFTIIFSSFLTDKQLLAAIPDEKWIFSMINIINMRLHASLSYALV